MARKTVLTTAALLMSATALTAETLSLDDLVARLTEQGFTEVEIERSTGRVKVEAKNARIEREIIYSSDGRILSDETEPRDDDDFDDDSEDDDDRDQDDDDEDDEDDDRDDDEDDDEDDRDDDRDEDDDDDDDDENDSDDDDDDD